MFTIRLTTSIPQAEVLRRLSACTGDELRLFVGHVGRERFRLRLGGARSDDAGLPPWSVFGKTIVVPGGTRIRGIVFAPGVLLALAAVAIAQGLLTWRIGATTFHLRDLLIAEMIIAAMLVFPLVAIIRGRRQLANVLAAVIELPPATDPADAPS